MEERRCGYRQGETTAARSRGRSGRVFLVSTTLGFLLFCGVETSGSRGSAFFSQEPEGEAAREVSKEDKWAFAVQNPILRDFFRELYPRIHSSRFPPQPAFVESFVDGQVENFLAELEGELAAIKSGVEMAQKLRGRMLANVSPRGERRLYLEALVAFRATLRRLEEDCDEVAGKLDIVFLFMKKDKQFTPFEGNKELFGEELEFLSREVGEAQRLINNYLFRSTNTVTFEDLKGENMLTRLHRAKEMARHIRENCR